MNELRLIGPPKKKAWTEAAKEILFQHEFRKTIKEIPRRVAFFFWISWPFLASAVSAILISPFFIVAFPTGGFWLVFLWDVEMKRREDFSCQIYEWNYALGVKAETEGATK